MIKGGATLDEVMQAMSKTFGGAASDAAETTAGKFKRMKIALDETKESIGASLMPAVEAVLPYLQGMADWASKNPTLFTVIAGTIGAVALSIMAVNTAMALNPFGLIAVGIGILVTGIAIAYGKFEGFRNLVRNVVNGLSDYFEFMANNWIKVTNILITGINLISPFKDIPKLGSVSFGKIGAEDKGAGFTSARQAEAAMFGGGSVSSSGGSAPIPVPTSVPGTVSKMPSRAVQPPAVFDNTSGNPGGFENAGIGGIGPFPNLVINVNGGDPQAVVDALRTYQQSNGSIPIRVSG
jgi:hypothetical protein